jgi:hypothetical protein
MQKPSQEIHKKETVTRARVRFNCSLVSNRSRGQNLLLLCYCRLHPLNLARSGTGLICRCPCTYEIWTSQTHPRNLSLAHYLFIYLVLKLVYRSLSIDQNHIDFIISFDKNWCSCYKLEITSSSI